MARSHPWSDANLDLYRRIQIPSPSIEESGKSSMDVL